MSRAFEGIIQVILEEIEAGTILEAAEGIREALQQRDQVCFGDV